MFHLVARPDFPSGACDGHWRGYSVVTSRLVNERKQGSSKATGGSPKNQALAGKPR